MKALGFTSAHKFFCNEVKQHFICNMVGLVLIVSALSKDFILISLWYRLDQNLISKFSSFIQLECD